MTITFGLFLLPFIYTMIFVFHPFGEIPMGFPSLLGIFIFLLFGLLFLTIKPIPFILKIKNPMLLSKILLIIGFFLIIWLFYIDRRFGHSPFISVLLNEPVNPSLLYARYRNQLPLRSVFPPLVTAYLLTSFLLFIYSKKTVCKLIVLLFSIAVSIIFVGVYDTRHIIIWFGFYLFILLFPSLNSLIKILKFKKLLYLLVVFGFIWGIFVSFGNIRTGYSASQSRTFALAMAVDEKYVDLPMPVIWGVIYGFGNSSRGITNDPNMEWISFKLPTKFFPGFLQRLYSIDPFQNLNSAFTAQSFGIDGWHSMILYFGYFGASVLLIMIFLICFLMFYWFFKKLSLKKEVLGYTVIIGFWVSLRIFLMPFGDYFFDFAAITELMFLIFFFFMGQITFKNKKTVKNEKQYINSK